MALAWIAGSASAADPQIASLKIESTLPVTGLQSTVTPAIPANVLASVAGGALEIREQITWSAATSSTGNATLKVDGFLVAPGSPSPTPPAAQSSPVLSFIVRIDGTIFSTKPSTAVTFVGTVISNDVVTPFGSVIGAQVIVSAGYKGSPVTFSNVVVLIPGLGSLYAPSAKGVVTFVGDPAPTTPPPSGTPGNRPPVAKAGSNSSTTLKEMQLDGSASTDPDGDTLTYSWRLVGRTSEITGANTAKPTVQLTEGFGDYIYELTVSDGKGGTSTATVTISYFGQ